MRFESDCNAARGRQPASQARTEVEEARERIERERLAQQVEAKRRDEEEARLRLEREGAAKRAPLRSLCRRALELIDERADWIRGLLRGFALLFVFDLYEYVRSDPPDPAGIWDLLFLSLVLLCQRQLHCCCCFRPIRK